MTVLNASDARANLYRLIDQTNESHEPVIISGKRSNAVLVAEEDWRSIQETLFLISIPGMRESILEAMKEPLAESVKGSPW
jgi:prevent-host-death family protein